MSTFDLATVDHLLSTTRAVRYRLDLTRPVPRDVVLDCLRLSQQAPTSHNGQNWRWIVVDDPAVRRQLGAIYAQALPAIEKAAAIPKADDQTRKVDTAALWFAEHIGEVPVLAVACMAERLPPDPPPVISASFYGSIYQAVWSFQLALRSRGLGSTFTTVHLMFEDQVRALLGIPEDVTQVAMVPVAYTKGDNFRPADRPTVETIVHWNRW